jgi:SpoVK/Ycf46/Vps4 family AAA+-type ATPase
MNNISQEVHQNVDDLVKLTKGYTCADISSLLKEVVI